MAKGNHLLLLAVLVFLAKCQQKPRVSMSPALKPIYSGDSFTLSCDNMTHSSKVKWYFNNKEEPFHTENILKIEDAALNYSGSYQCESNGQKSDKFYFEVMDFLPHASLSIHRGQPVMFKGEAFSLVLKSEEDLHGWICWVYKNRRVRKIIFGLEENKHVVIQPKELDVSEAIYWCSNNATGHRSNQLKLRTSEKDVRLEMLPWPPMDGKSLTLRCLEKAPQRISHTIFYKDGVMFVDKKGSVYQIDNLEDSKQGNYKCNATSKDRSLVSDDQELLFQDPPLEVALSASHGLSCSCPNCHTNSTYHWYYKNRDQEWTLKSSGQDHMVPADKGIYACCAVWQRRKSKLSNVYDEDTSSNPTGIIIAVLVVMVVMLFIVAGVVVVQRRRQNIPGPIYDDIALKCVDKEEERYQMLRQPQREGEYDVLQPDAPPSSHYEALKKEETEAQVYHTLQMEGAAGQLTEGQLKVEEA